MPWFLQVNMVSGVKSMTSSACSVAMEFPGHEARLAAKEYLCPSKERAGTMEIYCAFSDNSNRCSKVG
jgi:hypothetical protein